jgi:hypothetical protein
MFLTFVRCRQGVNGAGEGRIEEGSGEGERREGGRRVNWARKQKVRGANSVVGLV